MVSDALFQTAPAEVIRYFRAKRSLPSFDWRDVAPEEHAFSWTVAKSMEGDVLEDIRAAVDDAIVNRVPFEDFQQRLTPILKEKGWWGRRLQTDPADAIPKIVQLGSPRRLRTIYWANVRTAHAAGEWERTQRTKRFLPYLVYTLSVSERRREEHLRFVGIVAPVDDPIWNRIYPPNGWGCKCGVRQITAGEARRLGYEDDRPSPQLVMRTWRNKRTGQTMTIPEGVDPGWDTNPGKSRADNVGRFLGGQVAAMPAHRQRAAIDDIVGSPAFRALAEGRLPGSTFLPVAQLAPRLVEAFDARTGVVSLSADSVRHILTEHAERGLTVDDLRNALTVILRPAAAIRRGQGLVLLAELSGRWWRTVVKSSMGGSELWLVSLHEKSTHETLRFIERARERGDDLMQ